MNDTGHQRLTEQRRTVTLSSNLLNARQYLGAENVMHWMIHTNSDETAKQPDNWS